MIHLKDISKTFKIPHEREDSLKGSVLNILRGKFGYEKFEVLKKINMDVEKGEFVGIIGRNGGGKSTLLKIIAKVLVADSGRMIIKGKISPFLELGLGFQGEFNARQNVYLYGAVLGMTKREIDNKFDEIIKFAELEKFVDTKLKNYSSGMQVRLAFSVAIQASSDILLVDEVLAVGDATFQQKCYDVFERFRKEGKTVVFVSHDLDSIKKFCDKVYLINKGRIVKKGKPSEVIKYYNDKIVGTKK